MVSRSDARHRVAVVTGCSKPNGMGRAIAERLGKNHRILVTDVAPRGEPNAFEPGIENGNSWSGVESVVDGINASGGDAAYAFGDLRQIDDCLRVVNEALERFGRLDVLVNNAAAPHGDDVGEIDEIPAEEWDRIMDVNARGVFYMTRAAVPHMRQQKWGRIVSIASIAGIVGTPRHAAYSASKGAVLGFTKSAAIDLARDGITINAVCPGLVLTSRVVADARRGGDAGAEERIAGYANDIPVARHGLPEDIAAAVSFLVSEDASYVTGHGLTADGGQFRV